MPNISEQLEDFLTAHSIDINRLEAGTVRKLEGVLNSLLSRITKELKLINPTGPARVVYRERRARAYLQVLNSDLTRSYAQMEQILKKDLFEVAKLEARITADEINRLINVDLVSGAIIPEQLNAVVLETELLKGERLHQWFLAERVAARRLLRSTINHGVILGTPIDEMVRSVIGTKAANYRDGIGKQYRNRVRTIVRTSVNAITNATREQVYENNQDVIKGKQWASTLDSRTSSQCIALDSSSWDMENNPTGNNKHPWLGPPPIHPNCRSVLLPIMKSWGELNRNPAIQKKLKRAEAKIKPSTRANMDGDPVSVTTSYPTWLKRQSKERQLDVLGPTKYKLWKSGKLSLTDLIDQRHRPLTVEELKRKYA